MKSMRIQTQKGAKNGEITARIVDKEFPVVWYRAKGMDGTTATTFRDLVPVKLASAVWDTISMYKTNIANFPQNETCDLLIMDRSLDMAFSPPIDEEDRRKMMKASDGETMMVDWFEGGDDRG
ncbi:hypothetical protein L2E82_24899 [Cichorium intybus]|uniref:Uncharacterized protein n=1 Tax=Cichorium intybus TaxID=13427 RepID=A0ACB9E2E7_CICIN|nr:hypothetical protein L2E82_24899 [Cichorium intybus]